MVQAELGETVKSDLSKMLKAPLKNSVARREGVSQSVVSREEERPKVALKWGQ